MTTNRELAALNQAALDYRADQYAKDPHAFSKSGIKSLRKEPPYVGFVDCVVGDTKFVFFVCRSDDGVALRLLWKKEFEPTSTHIWNVLAKQSNFIIDIGGHSGVYSVIAGLSNPDAKVFTIEPHEINFGRLLLNLRSNGLSHENAHLCAASDENRTVPFDVNVNYYLSSGGSVVEGGESGTKMVSARRIDDLITLPKTSKTLIKIDTEGHETNVIDGMPIVMSGKPDIILETAFTTENEKLSRGLIELGYSVYEINENSFSLRPRSSLLPSASDGVVDRANVWLTIRSSEEVASISQLAHDSYQNRRQV